MRPRLLLGFYAAFIDGLQSSLTPKDGTERLSQNFGN